MSSIKNEMLISSDVKIDTSVYMDINNLTGYLSDQHITIDLASGVSVSQSNDSGCKIDFYQKPEIIIGDKQQYGHIMSYMEMEASSFNTGFKESFNINVVLPATDFGRKYLYEMEISYDKNPDIKFKFEFDPKNKIYTGDHIDIKISRNGSSSFSLTNNDIFTVYLYNQYKRLNPKPEPLSRPASQTPFILEDIDTASFTITKLILKREYL